MKYSTLFLFHFLFLFLHNANAQNPVYKSGDLVFQDLDCGDMCDAIESVTFGRDSLKFSHLGMIYTIGDSVYVIEAIGEKVQLTRFYVFKARSKKPLLHARLNKYFDPIIPGAIEYALQQINVPYDNEFIYDNGKYYCSELIYDAFRIANHYEPVFELEPMNFKNPTTGEFLPFWVKYYKKLKREIPQGEPGINPAGMSRSPKIEVVR